MAAEPQAAVTAELDRLAGAMPSLGVAVSGGGDSLALLHMAAAWGRQRGIAVEAATVDHALRPESADEAALVARACTALDVPHRVLAWDHGGRVLGNLMAAARAARLRLLSGWAQDRALGAVALGHSQDDQAETLLMRLGRGAGVDGLSGMAAARRQAGTLWLRPMLGVRREALRAWLTARGIGWADDPSNDDAGFDRIRVRQAIAAAGLPVDQLARSAAQLAEARAALAEAAIAAARDATSCAGVLRLPRTDFAAAHPEIRRRLTAAAIRWVTGADYAPRGGEVARLAEAVASGAQATLDGVIARADGAWVEFLREPAATQPGRCPGPRDISGQKMIWDARWQIVAPPGAAIRAVLPSDLAGRHWRGCGLPRAAVLSSPAIVAGGRVIVPLLDGDDGGIVARPLRGLADFVALLRAH